NNAAISNPRATAQLYFSMRIPVFKPNCRCDQITSVSLTHGTLSSRALDPEGQGAVRLQERRRFAGGHRQTTGCDPISIVHPTAVPFMGADKRDAAMHPRMVQITAS